MDEIWERAVETALEGEKDHASARTLTLDGVVKCVQGRLPHPSLLEKFDNLQHLSIANIGVSSLEQFPRLRNLQKLNLSDNRIAGGLEFLVDAGLDSLRDLDLSNNRIQFVEDLAPLAQLRIVSLDLYECPVTRVRDYRSKVFGMIKSLKYLDKMDAEENERLETDEEEEEEEDDDDEEGVDDDDDEEEEEEEEEDDDDNDDDDDDDDEEEEEEEEEEDPGSGEVDGEERLVGRVVSNGHRGGGEGIVDVDEDEESDADEEETETGRGGHGRPSENGFRVVDVEGHEEGGNEEDEEENELEEGIDVEDGDDVDVVEVHDIDDSSDEDGVEDFEDDDEGGEDDDANDDDEEEEEEEEEEVDNDEGDFGEPESVGRLPSTGDEIDGHEQGDDDVDEDDNGETGEDEQGVGDDGEFEDEEDGEEEDGDSGAGFLVQRVGQAEVHGVGSSNTEEEDEEDELEGEEEVEDDEVQVLASSSQLKRKRDDVDEEDVGNDEEADDVSDRPKASSKKHH